MKNKIYFNEDGHKYFFNDILLKNSATTVCKMFSAKFDSDYTSRVCAYKEILGEDKFKKLRRECFGFDFKPLAEYLYPIFDDICGGEDAVELVKDTFILNWDNSGILGTEFHKKMENKSIDRGYEINPWDNKKYDVFTFKKKYSNQVYDMDLSKLPDGFHPELLVYVKDLPIKNTIVGTADKVFIETIDGVRYTDTDDYKTVAKQIENYKYNRCTSPLDHLWDNKITSYSLQATIYQEALRSHGFVPRNAGFTSYLNYDESTAKLHNVILLKNEFSEIKKFLLK